MYCKKCGTLVEACYCPKCGTAKPINIPNSKVGYAESKFCAKCGKSVEAVYCTGCGKPRSMTVSAAGFMPSFGRKPSGGSSGESIFTGKVEVPAMKFSFEWALMGIILLFALSTMSWFSAVMLLAAIAPAAIAVFEPNLYNKQKFMLHAGGAGVGLLFAFLATFIGVLRFNVFSLILCIVGLLIIGLIGAREEFKLKLPPICEDLLGFIEGPMYFYIVAAYFALATSFIRIVVSIDLWIETLVISTNLSAGRTFWLLIVTAVLVLPPLLIKYLLIKGKTEQLKPLIFALAGSALFGLIFIPLFVRRSVGVPLLFTFVGLGGVALAVYVLFHFKEILLKATEGVAGSFSAMAASTTPASTRTNEPQRMGSAVTGGVCPPSLFHGSIASLIGIRILSVLLPGIVVGIMIFIMFQVRSVGAIIALLILIYPLAILAWSYTQYLLMRWEVTNSEVAGVMLGFNGVFVTYVILQLKIGLLSLITFGLYFWLGAASAAVIRWKIKNIYGATSEESRFNGYWYDVFAIRLGVGFLRAVSIPIIFLITSGLTSLTLNPMNIFNGNFGIISFGASFIFGIILTAVLMAGVQLFLSALMMFFMMRFEISNAYVDGRQWRFTGSIGGVVGVVVINGILSVVTLGIYGLLGFPHLLFTQYKIRNIDAS